MSDEQSATPYVALAGGCALIVALIVLGAIGATLFVLIYAAAMN